MPDKKKKICYSSLSLLLAFIAQRSQSTQLHTRPDVFPYDTCWLIDPLDYHCSFPFPEIGDSFLSPAGWRRRHRSTTFSSAKLHLIFRIRTLRLTQTPPGPLAMLFVFTCFSQEKWKRRCLFPCYAVARKHGGLLKQTECRCLLCGKKGCGKKGSRQMKGWG